MHKISWTILTILFLSFSGYAQKCFEYHKSACTPQESKFTYDESSSSVSFQFIAGQKRQMDLELFAGKDYRITICGNDVFNDVILFKIINENGKIIYDNSKFKYLLNLEFSSQKTQIVQVELEVPDVSLADSLKPKGCVGILVEDMVSIKTGF